MTVKQRSKPRYAELGDMLQTGIERGDYPVGSLLPTELELCERYQVSRHTARAALTQLIAAKLVQRRPGSGTRVIAQREAMRYEHEIDNLDLLIQYGNSTRLQVLAAHLATATAGMAKQLEISAGDDYLHLDGLRLEEPGREPIAVTEMLVPIRAETPVADMLDLSTSPRTVAMFLDASRLSQVEQVFDAVSLQANEARLLGVKRSEPAMRVQRHYRDADGHLLMLAISKHPPGQFAYSMVLSRTRR